MTEKGGALYFGQARAVLWYELKWMEVTDAGKFTFPQMLCIVPPLKLQTASLQLCGEK